MTKTQRILLTTLIIAALGYGALQWWKNFSFSDKFDVKFIGKKFSFTGIHNGSFIIDLSLTNKFPFDVTITGYNITVYANGTAISTLVNNGSYVLKQNVPTSISLQGQFDPLSVFKTLTNFQVIQAALQNPSSFKVRVAGTLGVKLKNIPIGNAPVDFTMTLADFLPQ